VCWISRDWLTHGTIVGSLSSGDDHQAEQDLTDLALEINELLNPS
jgi:hypothetical protein